MAGRKQTTTVSNKIKIKCVPCSHEKGIREFYTSNKPEHIVFNGKAPYCKDCVRSMIYDENSQVKREGFINFLSIIDRPMIQEIFLEILPVSTSNNIVSNYINRLNLKGYKNLTYSDTSRFTEVLSESKNIKQEISNQETSIKNDYIKEKNDVIKLLGYDPFLGYGEEDKEYLYGSLVSFLNEDTLEDGIKLSAYIQIVNNNNQIRKIDLTISQLSGDIKNIIKNAKDVDTLQGTKSKIVASNDKIMKENSISVKNRGDKKAGRSTLTYMMRDLRELNFEDAEEDYYNQKKAYGMKLVADISNKSILEQLHFDENDYVDMLKTQKEKIQESDKIIDDLTEENRQLYIEIDKLKSMICNKE